MQDHSYLDKKYFLDETVYNCPFCNRRNIHYKIIDSFKFNWTAKKICFGFITECSHCKGHAMHLSFKLIASHIGPGSYSFYKVPEDIDSEIFYSVPTSFFVLDERISRTIRELITEAEGCLKMNYLTGASACMRKSIYELLILEECNSTNYDDKIKELKQKHPNTDPELFDILAHIKDMTSDKVHEQSWDEWDTNNLKLIIETLKVVLYDIYVIPKIKAERSKTVLQLKEQVFKTKEP